MKRILCLSLLLATAGAGCEGEPTEPRGEVMLESLEFIKTEARPGETLVLRARLADTAPDAPLTVSLSTTSGARDTARILSKWDSPWRKMSDEQITAALAVAPFGQAFIGFKEAGAVEGVGDKAVSLTSPETVARMTQWVTEQGIKVVQETKDLPIVVVEMPAELPLVRTVRHHPNVDYLEPATWGELTSSSEAPIALAVTPTTTGTGEGLVVHSGDIVTATYRQPDGSRLTAQIKIQ